MHEAVNRVGPFAPDRFSRDEEKKNFKPHRIRKDKLFWYVFYEDFNRNEIVAINVFDTIFAQRALKAKKDFKDDFNGFAQEIERSLLYCFWSKAEFETIITSWPPYIDAKELERLENEKRQREESELPIYRLTVNLECGYKIDIYDQIMMNFERFIEYLWENRHLLTKKKLEAD